MTALPGMKNVDSLPIVLLISTAMFVTMYEECHEL